MFEGAQYALPCNQSTVRRRCQSMTSGTGTGLANLPIAMRELLEEARRAVLSTVDDKGRPHAVPVIYAVIGSDIATPIDRKPKTGRPLGRLKNLEANPNATLLVDRWSEEWSELAWVMVRGRATLEPAAESEAEIEAIISRYTEYRETLENSDVIRLVPERVSWWSWS